MTVHDVAIVGFGPVGQLLALLLGRAGHDVLVLERWPRPYAMPRAVHFDDEVGRIFQAAGVADRVRAITEPVPDFYEWRNRDGASLVRIDWSGTGACGWPVANFFSQPELEAVLTAAVAELPGVTVRRGMEVTGLDDTGDGVRLTARAAADGGERAFHARYAVGADGANSFVRDRIGTGVTDLGFFYDWLIVDTVPRDRRAWSPMNWQLCDPRRPTTIVSGGPGRRRWEFLVLRGTAGAALLDTYTTERREHVQHAIGMSMALGRVICVLDDEEAAARDARMIAADADDAYLPHMREHGHIAAVIRPDFYLFGAAATPGELRELIGQLHSRLHVRPGSRATA